MSQKDKKIEKKAEKTPKEIKGSELSDKELDSVAGGGANAINTSRSNTKEN